MTQRWIRAALYRGGSSKGVFFHARDLPETRAEIEPILLRVLGSPDPNGRQLDGLGGGILSLSKAAIVAPSARPDADVDFTFVQVAVDRPVCDWDGVCGNLTAAVGPFAVEEGLVRCGDGECRVRIHETSTGKIIHSVFPVSDGRPVVTGDFRIAGVAGSGAMIRLARFASQRRAGSRARCPIVSVPTPEARRSASAIRRASSRSERMSACRQANGSSMRRSRSGQPDA